MVKKIAVSMAEPIFRDMERARKSDGKTRSEWLQGAVTERLRREKLAADIAAYIRGYELHPETDEEVAAVAASAAHGPVYDDEWPEAPM